MTRVVVIPLNSAADRVRILGKGGNFAAVLSTDGPFELAAEDGPLVPLEGRGDRLGVARGRELFYTVRTATPGGVARVLVSDDITMQFARAASFPAIWAQSSFFLDPRILSGSEMVDVIGGNNPQFTGATLVTQLNDADGPAWVTSSAYGGNGAENGGDISPAAIVDHTFFAVVRASSGMYSKSINTWMTSGNLGMEVRSSGNMWAFVNGVLEDMGARPPFDTYVSLHWVFGGGRALGYYNGALRTDVAANNMPGFRGTTIGWLRAHLGCRLGVFGYWPRRLTAPEIVESHNHAAALYPQIPAV